MASIADARHPARRWPLTALLQRLQARPRPISAVRTAVVETPEPRKRRSYAPLREHSWRLLYAAGDVPPLTSAPRTAHVRGPHASADRTPPWTRHVRGRDTSAEIASGQEKCV